MNPLYFPLFLVFAAAALAVGVWVRHLFEASYPEASRGGNDRNCHMPNHRPTRCPAFPWRGHLVVIDRYCTYRYSISAAQC